jgi:hypothetical protein
MNDEKPNFSADQLLELLEPLIRRVVREELARALEEQAATGTALPLARDSFRQGWREAVAGQTRPVAELWSEIESG